jgi:hypothetical protein
MTQPAGPAGSFVQHPRLAELVTALGFRRYRLFLAGLLYGARQRLRPPGTSTFPLATMRRSGGAAMVAVTRCSRGGSGTGGRI